MSLYNMLFGRNPNTAILLAVIGLKENDVERFRDVSIDDGGKFIEVYTRTGGNNRGDYPQKTLFSSPHFVRTWDDDFDSTYAYFTFRTPQEFVEDVQHLSDVFTHGLRPEFAQHLAKTLNRAPTEGDLAAQAYQEERYALSRTEHTMLNGHTFVPFTDAALKTALKLAEANDGKLRSAWGIFPARLVVHQNRERWSGFERAAVEAVWETDTEYWQRILEKYAEKFPKAVEAMRRQVENYTKAGAAS